MPLTTPTIQGEYWITKDGVLPVESDGGHEQEALNQIRAEALGALDVSINDDIDKTDVEKAAAIYIRALGEDPSDLKAALERVATPASRILLRWLKVESTLSAARDEAMRSWGWIRVAQNNIEAYSLDASQAKNLREQILTLLFDHEGWEDEVEALQTLVHLDVYDRGTFTLTVDELGDPDRWSAHKENFGLLAAPTIAKNQIQKLQASSLHPFYQGLEGD